MGKRPRLSLKDCTHVMGFRGWDREELHKGEALRVERTSLGVGRSGCRRGEVHVEEGAGRGDLDGQ